MKNISKIIIFSLLLSLATLWPIDIFAQCPMCRSAVESAMQNEGNTIGLGLNKGILYLLSAPYILVLGVAGYWFYNRKKKASENVYEA